MGKRFINQHFVGSDGMKYFIGVVENRSDPLQLGRCRVRVHGYHIFDEALIPTEELPWAFPIMPLDSAGVSGVGNSISLMIGTVVLGFWGDWPDCQTPFMLGTINQSEFFGGAANLFRPGSGGPMGSDNTLNDTSSAGGPGTINPTGDGPQWLQIARGELGVTETKGPSHNPEVLKYGRDLGFYTDDSQHPWCAAFTRWCLKEAGQNVSGMTGMAKSALTASSMERLDSPLYGCVAVKHRSASQRNSPSGHTGFWVGRSGGKDKYLGGNQGNKVSIVTYSTNAHAGYRWPKGASRDLANTVGTANNEVTSTSNSQG